MEEILLVTVHQLGENAYGVPIKERVQTLLGRSVSVGAVYVPLDRLAARGLLSTWHGDPAPERGGRRKKFYKLTRAGLAILRRTRELNDLLWSDARV
jgi:DNA-binding PadR family transcriptional regulator